MRIDVEFYRPGIAEVTFVPSLWRRILRARTIVRFARRTMGIWSWDDGGWDYVGGDWVGHDMQSLLDAKHYARFDRPKRWLDAQTPRGDR